MIEGGSRQQKLPQGYIHQHTLWTRKTFNREPHSRQWRSHSGMILIMPKKDEEQCHAAFQKIEEFKPYDSGLPLPSRDLARLALNYLNGMDPEIGRKRRFERLASYMRDIANSTNGKTQAAEARLFADHFAIQLDFYDNVLTAKEERDLWLPS